MCVRGMCEGVVGKVVMVLRCLGEQEQWEVRHASLMGIQHLLAARTVSLTREGGGGEGGGGGGREDGGGR